MAEVVERDEVSFTYNPLHYGLPDDPEYGCMNCHKRWPCSLVRGSTGHRPEEGAEG